MTTSKTTSLSALSNAVAPILEASSRRKRPTRSISMDDYLKGLRAASTPFNKELGETLEKAANPDTVTLKGGTANGRSIRARGFFAWLATVDINETREALDNLLGPVHDPIPAIPVGTFVAHDVFGFGYTAGPVLEGGRAGHKVDVLFEDEEEPRRILLSFLDFDDVSSDEAEAEKDRLIAERVGKEVTVCLPELDEVIEPDFTEGNETGDDWVAETDDTEVEDDTAAPEFVQAELSELS